MKTFFIILLLPVHLFAQDITGIWTGHIITTEKNLPYEVVISDNNGKLSGYSHTTFTVNGEEITSVKTVKIKNDNGQVSIEDDDLIYNDFKVKPPKKVRQSDDLTLKTQGSVMMLNGTFSTNKIRELKPATGTITLQKQDTSVKTKIIPKLKEMNLLGNLSFLQPKKEEPPVVVVEPPAPVLSKESGIQNTPPVKTNTSLPVKAINKNVAVIKPKELPPVPQPKPAEFAKVDTAKEKKPVAVITPKPKEIVVNTPPPVKKLPPPPPQKQVVAVAKPPVEKKELPKPQVKALVNPPAPAPVMPKQTIAVAPPPDLSKRQIETIQGLYINSDSLTLTLYDNGEVDGDTVSILMNGKVIISKQGLSTNAFTKTIYVTPDLGDSLQLIMYAENLGSIPPNTGLLILQDGNIRHEIRFSGDLKKNAAITLRKKPK